MVLLEVTGKTFRVVHWALDPRAGHGEYGRGLLRREPGRLLLHFTSMEDPNLIRDAVLREEGDGFVFDYWRVDGEDDVPRIRATVVLRPDYPDFPGGLAVPRARLPSAR